MLKQIFGIVLLTTVSLFAQEWDGSWETAITDQEQKSAVPQESTAQFTEKNTLLVSEAALLREEGMAQRRKGNVFLGTGIGGVVLGGILYVGGIISSVEHSDCDRYDDGYSYRYECEAEPTGAEALAIIGGGAMAITGGVFIAIGIIHKVKGGRKIRRADNLERMVFDFVPIIDIPNGRAGGVFTAAF